MSEPTDDNIKKLPVRFKSPAPPERSLLLAYEAGSGLTCHHGPFIVDEELAQVVCEKCKERLNPMWVLRRMAGEDRTYHDAHAKYHEEMKRLGERSRTKCQHCGQMTRISYR